MSNRANPRQLVLRRDTATGLTLVGWETDLPMGRFEHLELICELNDAILPDLGDECYAAYQAALQCARQANSIMLAQQIRHNKAKGWYPIPFELAASPLASEADSLGHFTTAAMQLHFQLTRNFKQVWVVVKGEEIIHVRSQRPARELDELSYQVWYHHQFHQLKRMGGTVLEGNLIICESGLWFDESTAPD